MTRRLVHLAIIALALIGAATPFSSALAACVSPAGEESKTVYDFSGHTLKYCDGTSWLTFAAGTVAATQWNNGTGGAIYYSSGNVGIGTTGPTQKLDVQGQALFGTTAYTVIFLRDDDSTGGPKSIHANSDVVGFLNGSGGWMSYLNNSGTWNPLSDARLKKNIVTLTGALEKVSKMRGVTFEWIDPERGTEKNIGVIAQEVEKEYPELISTDDQGYKHVTYDRFGPITIEAIKELKAANDNQAEELRELREEFRAYKAAHP